MTKLNLNRETLRTLDAHAAASVNGAMRFSGVCVTSEGVPCIPPTETPGCWSIGLCITGNDCGTLI